MLSEAIGIAPRMSDLENPNVNLYAAIDAFEEAMGGTMTPAGVAVSEKAAFKTLVAANCIHVITETVATLPAHVFEEYDDGSRRNNRAHWVRRCLTGEANPEMSGLSLVEAIGNGVLSWGRGFAFIDYTPRGRLSMYPLPPGRTRLEVIEDNRGRPTKVVLFLANGKWLVMPPEQVLHVPWMTLDGIQGFSPIRVAGGHLGLALAMEKFAQRFFGAGAFMSGFVTVPAKLSDTHRSALREHLESMHSGLDRSHRFAIIDAGATFKEVNLPLEDMQLLESRAFTDARIAGLYRLTPDRINIFEKAATYASLDATEIRHVKDAVKPLVRRLEVEIDRHPTLLDRWREGAGSRFYVRFNLDEALRGDPKARAEVLAIERQHGVRSADEWRTTNDQDPIGGVAGETYLWPENLRPADMPYPTSRGGTVESGSQAPSGATSSADARAQAVAAPSMNAAKALRVALSAAFERSARREGHALGRLVGKGGDPREAAGAWYDQQFDVERLAGELALAVEVLLAASGADLLDGEVLAYALQRATGYRDARARGARAGVDAPPVTELVDAEAAVMIRELLPRLSAQGG